MHVFPHIDICAAALGCHGPADAMQLGLSPQRIVAIATVWLLTWVNLRGVREGKFVQTSMTVIKTAVLALLVILGHHGRATRRRDRRQLWRGPLRRCRPT